MTYGLITGSGAEKLAESAVAPLVAVAHGFQTVLPDEVKSVAERYSLAPNSTPFKQLRSAVGDRDAMLLKWFSPADVVEQSRVDYPLTPSSIQIRSHPANVRTDESGKKRKYDNLAGQQLVFGIHPSTPPEWLLEPIKHLLLAEGAMKADSALTAYLRKHGATDKQLSVSDDMDQMAAMDKLRDLMRTIDDDERVVIMSVVGVGTWHKNPEWNTLRLTDGEVWVSFDGDVGTNPNVWTQADQMFTMLKHKGATPMLVDLSDLRGPMGEKIGVDDFLADGHDWDDLMGRITDELPKRPDGSADGKYRMNDKTLRMEEKVVHKDDSGNDIVEWVPKVDLTAHVVQITERREVTLEEEETGNYALTVSPKGIESECTIKVEWMENGERHSSLVEGPTTLLATKPERWTDSRLEVGISSDVLGLPAWPPTANGFLEAMKSHRRGDVEHTAAWTHMGWVPRVDGGTPVYCVGTQVIGASGFEPGAAVSGVTESDLAGATNFGVDMPENDEQARDDIRTMVNTYRACWSDLGSFAVVLAAALRPTVPLQTSVPVLFSGSSGSGKALPMDSMVPTPTGWKRVSEIETGDTIFSGDGPATKVRSLSDVFYDEDIYELTLSDGQKVRMSGNHVVPVSTRGSRIVNRRVTKRSRRAAALRRFADSITSGDANTLVEIAKAIGLSYHYVWRAAQEAGVPHHSARVVGNHHNIVEPETQTIAGFTIARYPMSTDRGSKRANRGTKAVELYPVSEVVYAVADLIDYDGAQPLTVSRKVSELVDTFAGESYGIPLFPGFDATEADLPIAPYTFGAWLGDGTSIRGDITNVDQDVLDSIATDGYTLSKVKSATCSWSIDQIGRRVLMDVGVYDNKHIPMKYLRASRPQRLAVLQGLMDTDGTIDKGGSCELTLSDERLATDALELIRSLGIKASMKPSKSGYRSKKTGEYIECKTRWRIHFTTDQMVFRMSRKAKRVPTGLRSSADWLFITDIKPVEQVPSRCLQVEHPTGRFVHDGFVVTHNSFSSAAIMGFWQPAPNRWSGKHLPGSASDTPAATEIAVSKAPLWILDDNAPSTASPRAQAERTEAVNQTIRNVHNGAGKRRATKDMGSQKTNTPRALLVVSAESAPLDDQSIMNRLVHVEVQPGFLVKSREPTDELERMNRETTIAARVTGRALQMVAADIAKRGWLKVRNEWKEQMSQLAKDAGEVIEDAAPTATSSVKRQSETIADMMLGLDVFRNLCADVGLGAEMDDVIGEMFDALQALAIEGFTENQRADLGNRFIGDVRTLLSSQQAHIAGLGIPGAPCVVGSGGVETAAHADSLNQFLGWKLTGDADRPTESRGELIGMLVHTKAGKPVVLFSDAAYHITQRKATARGGTNPKSVWDAVWKSGLAVPESEGWKRKPRGQKLDYRVRVMVDKVVAEGVPVYLSTLMGNSED